MASTIAWPQTPSAPSSSASSSSTTLTHHAPQTPPYLRTPPSSYATQHFTPPSSPPLPPLQPTPTSSRTLHLRSPHKPALSTFPALPATSPSRRNRQQLIVKGNVTPSRASAFFAPRPQQRQRNDDVLPGCTPSSTRGYYASLTAASPSGHTSARRGVKRQRRPEESIPESPSSSRRGGRDRMMLEGDGAGHWDDSSDDDQGEGYTGDARWYAWAGSEDEERLSMATPERRSLARRGPTSPSIGSAARRAGSSSSQSRPQNSHQRRPQPNFTATPSPRKPVPLAMRTRQGGVDLAGSMAALRCGAGGGRGRGLVAVNAIYNQVSHVPAYQRYRSHPDHSVYTLPSLSNSGETLNQPLACAYSYSSRSYTSSRQWLAVGDNEGVLSLLDTSRDPTLSTYIDMHDGPADRPTWQATLGSLFSVSWRFDDAYLASSGSDYTTKIWDTSTLSCVHSFVGSRGTSRAIEWDPHSSGNLLASGGRDGAIHVYDLRMATKEAALSTVRDDSAGEDNNRLEPTSPLLSLWSAHAPSPALTATGYRSRINANTTTAKGVTSLIYHPHRPHALFTAGCADASIKLWDLRFAVASGEADQQLQEEQRTRSSASSKGGEKERIPFSNLSSLANTTPTSSSAKRKTRQPRKARAGDPSFVLSSSVLSASDDSVAQGTGLASDPLEIKPLFESGDLSLDVGRQWNARSHGISCLTQGGGRMFAAVTDGRIYSLPLSSLSPSPGTSTSFVHNEETTVLYHPTQLGNSLYNRLALCPDERTLAIGCNEGSVVLWDTKVRKAAVLGQGRSVNEWESSDDEDEDEDDSEEEEEEEEGGGGEDFNPFRRPTRHIGTTSRRTMTNRQDPARTFHRDLPRRSSGIHPPAPPPPASQEREGHRINCEINALDWCFDVYSGWRLATCGDDMAVRIWESELGGTGSSRGAGAGAGARGRRRR